MIELKFHPDALAGYRLALGIGAFCPRSGRRFALETDRLLHQIVAAPDSFPAYGEGRRLARIRSMKYAFVFERMHDEVHVLVAAADIAVHDERPEDAWSRHLKAETYSIPAVPAVMNRDVFDATPDKLLCSALYCHHMLLYTDRPDQLLREPTLPLSYAMIHQVAGLDQDLAYRSAPGLVSGIILNADSLDPLVQTLKRIGADHSAQLYVEATQIVLPDGVSPFDQTKYEDNIEAGLALLDTIVAPIAAISRVVEIATALRSEANERFNCMTRWCRKHPEQCLEAEETVIEALRQRMANDSHDNSLPG